MLIYKKRYAFIHSVSQPTKMEWKNVQRDNNEKIAKICRADLDSCNKIYQLFTVSNVLFVEKEIFFQLSDMA